TFYQHEVRLRHQASGQIVSTAITPCLSTDSLYVARNTALAGLRFNIAVEDDGKSFWVLRLKVRDRIVADGIDDPSFDAS
ncbi:hypothetical protein INR21_29915, partial [Klebsiella pneumoniae]|nr:hypothetical protein [Klebsiella pneumoniae]